MIKIIVGVISIIYVASLTFYREFTDDACIFKIECTAAKS